MNITDIKSNLEKLQSNGFEFELNPAASEETFATVEKNFGLTLPEGTKEFFKSYNGLKTRNPALEIFPVQDWKKHTNGLVHFATFNEQIEIAFDSNEMNNASQWSIINSESNYELTKSMRSFWSNKIWHWLKNKKEIWADEYWVK